MRLLQFCSDLHLDRLAKLPTLKKAADTLGIAGDLGHPLHPNFSHFLEIMSRQYTDVVIVPGNHDIGCSSLYNHDTATYFRPLARRICAQFPNVHFLEEQTHALSDGETVIAGTTLWTHLPFTPKNAEIAQKFADHNREHAKAVKFLHSAADSGKKVIALTHFMPSFSMIAPAFARSPPSSQCFFATELTDLLKHPNIAHWITGHSHYPFYGHKETTQLHLNPFWTTHRKEYIPVKTLSF